MRRVDRLPRTDALPSEQSPEAWCRETASAGIGAGSVLRQPTDIQVRMIEGVDRAEAIACLESRPSPDPHSRQPARRVPGWNEPHVVEWAAIRVATDAKVHVGDRTHADGLVERAEGRHAVKLW